MTGTRKHAVEKGQAETIETMRLAGRISSFSRRKGKGLIKLTPPIVVEGIRRSLISFSLKSISNDSLVLRQGQIASFGLKHARKGRLTAVDVFVVPDDAPDQFDPDHLNELYGPYVHSSDDDGTNIGEGAAPPFANAEAGNDEFIALALFGKKLKLVSFTGDGEYKFLDERHNLHNILYIAISETLALQTAVEEFEALINTPKVKESDFQNFFERNRDFILNDDYKEAHPHVVLSRNTKECLIPDFVLEPIQQGAEFFANVVYERTTQAAIL